MGKQPGQDATLGERVVQRGGGGKLGQRNPLEQAGAGAPAQAGPAQQLGEALAVAPELRARAGLPRDIGQRAACDMACRAADRPRAELLRQLRPHCGRRQHEADAGAGEPEELAQ